MNNSCLEFIMNVKNEERGKFTENSKFAEDLKVVIKRTTWEISKDLNKCVIDVYEKEVDKVICSNYKYSYVITTIEMVPNELLRVVITKNDYFRHRRGVMINFDQLILMPAFIIESLKQIAPNIIK